MADISKGKNPFNPGQPVPGELFVGRAEQIDRIITRGVKQVALGKPVAMFVEGEYGIGKSSIAGFVQWLAEKDYGLHGVYATLGGAKDLSDVARAILEATIRSGAFDPKRSEKIKNWLADYIGKQELFGVTLNLDALKRDAPNLSTPFGLLGFLGQARECLEETGVKGVFLVLDEINGITADPHFAHFMKGLVDTSALSREPLPLLLMLCGVEERRHEMIQKHQSVGRIFDVIDIEVMSKDEMEEFFTRAFESAHMTVDLKAMEILTLHSAGLPKIMHLVGQEAYWIDGDGVIDADDAITAVLATAGQVGKKFVDQQVYKALRSEDYRSILAKIAKLDPKTMGFSKAQVAQGLTDPEKRKFNNFLQKMKKLNVIKPGDVDGEWVFSSRMVRLYIWLDHLHKPRKAN